MNFKTDYFDGDYREGFFVESMMKRAWAAELEVLAVIDRICEKHQIQYFADWGTLLGAVRHHGFIPWDDDMDIAMMRDDYQRFLSAAPDELPDGYRLLHPDTEETYTETFAHIVNRNTISFAKEDLDQFHGCPYIVGIDLFPLDTLPGNQDEEDVQCELLKLLYSVVELCENKGDELETMITLVEQTCKIKFDRSKELKIQLLRMADRICQLYHQDDGGDITLLPWFINRKNFRLKREWYSESILMPFENIMIPVPKDYDAVLKVMYGEYQIPVRDTQGHEYPFYKKQQEIVERMM